MLIKTGQLVYPGESRMPSFCQYDLYFLYDEASPLCHLVLKNPERSHSSILNQNGSDNSVENVVNRIFLSDLDGVRLDRIGVFYADLEGLYELKVTPHIEIKPTLLERLKGRTVRTTTSYELVAGKSKVNIAEGFVKSMDLDECRDW